MSVVEYHSAEEMRQSYLAARKRLRGAPPMRVMAPVIVAPEPVIVAAPKPVAPPVQVAPINVVKWPEPLLREMGHIHEHPGGCPTISAILCVVALHSNLSRDEILARRRSQPIAFPRQIVMYLACTMTKRTLPEIGRYLGGFDHTTVLHGRKKIAEKITTDEVFAATIEKLKNEILKFCGIEEKSNDANQFHI